MADLNGVRQPFAADDVAGFERFLAGIPTAPGFWEVSLAGYDENWFTVRFNADRAWLRFVADGERAVLRRVWTAWRWSRRTRPVRRPGSASTSATKGTTE